MAGVYIKGLEIPKVPTRFIIFSDGRVEEENDTAYKYSAVPVSDHGRLGDLDELRDKMYHGAFETDTPLQRWDSGCWIRYKMFEDNIENAPTVIPRD